MTDEPNLRRGVAEVADACGLDVARALVEARRGRLVYVPQVLEEGHPLATALGLDLARRLVEHYGGDRIDVPMSLTDEAEGRRLLILELNQRGVSRADIAAQAGCTERRVFQVLAGQKSDPRQSSLF